MTARRLIDSQPPPTFEQWVESLDDHEFERIERLIREYVACIVLTMEQDAHHEFRQRNVLTIGLASLLGAFACELSGGVLPWTEQWSCR